jgi:hypothetical protein
MSNFKFSSSFFQVEKMQPLKKLMRFSCQQLILRQIEIPSKLTCTGISQSSTLQHTFIHNYSTTSATEYPHRTPPKNDRIVAP